MDLAKARSLTLTLDPGPLFAQVEVHTQTLITIPAQVWAFIRCDQFTYRKFLMHFYSTATQLDPRSQLTKLGRLALQLRSGLKFLFLTYNII